MPPSPYVRTLRNMIGNELLMLQSVTVMLFDDRRRLLLARDAESGLWKTLGGAVDPDEAPADAAVRECWEETGVLIDVTGVLGVFGGCDFRISYSNGDTSSYVVTVFEGRVLEGEPRPDGVEITDLCYVSRAESQEMPMAVWTRQMVDRAFEYDGTPYFARPSWRPARQGGGD